MEEIMAVSPSEICATYNMCLHIIQSMVCDAQSKNHNKLSLSNFVKLFSEYNDIIEQINYDLDKSLNTPICFNITSGEKNDQYLQHRQ